MSEARTYYVVAQMGHGVRNTLNDAHCMLETLGYPEIGIVVAILYATRQKNEETKKSNLVMESKNQNSESLSAGNEALKNEQGSSETKRALSEAE